MPTWIPGVTDTVLSFRENIGISCFSKITVQGDKGTMASYSGFLLTPIFANNKMSYNRHTWCGQIRVPIVPAVCLFVPLLNQDGAEGMLHNQAVVDCFTVLARWLYVGPTVVVCDMIYNCLPSPFFDWLVWMQVRVDLSCNAFWVTWPVCISTVLQK